MAAQATGRTLGPRFSCIGPARRAVFPRMSWLALALVAALAQEVRVLDPEGKPAADVTVVAHVGLTRLALAEDFERWVSVKRLEARTDAEGRATFAGVPQGSRLTAFARSGATAGLAEGEGELELRLQASGALAGKLKRKRGTAGYSVVLVGPKGFERREATLDGDEWTAIDLAPGGHEVEVRVMRWLAARGTVEVAAGKGTAKKPAKAPAVAVGDSFLTGADPLVDARTVRLVDAEGEPVPGLKMAWSNPGIDGWMPSDAEGEIPLVGGNVMLGPPPFVLRLASLGIDQEEKFLGELVEIERGTAIVRVAEPLEELTVRVMRAGAPVSDFGLWVVTGEEDEARVWHGRDGGEHTVRVPCSELRLVVLTPDGSVHEERLVRAVGKAEHVVALDGG
jgi:hypothetical protein